MSSTELIALEKLEPAIIFAPGGIDPILKAITDEVRSVKTDISTKQGRTEIASLAHKIARSKTFLDEAGKTLGEDAKKKIDVINAERKKAREQLDLLKDEVRAPLTEWEEADDKRIEAHETALKTIELAGIDSATRWEFYTSAAMRDRLGEIQKEFSLTDWQEFKTRADDVVEKAVRQIGDAIAKRDKHDADAAELERLRADAAERQKAEDARLQKEREDRLAAEAAAAATKAAEEKAAADAKAIADAAAAALAAQQAATAKAAQDAADATKRAEQAESDRIAAAKKADDDAKAAAVKAELDQRAAVQAEKDRQAAATAAETAAAAKREADKAHHAKINNDVLRGIETAMKTAKSGDDVSRSIVEAIARGQVPHVKISY